MRASTAILLVFFPIVSVVAPDLTGTAGELAFLKAIGRHCPVVGFGPAGKAPDEPKTFGQEQAETMEWRGSDYLG